MTVSSLNVLISSLLLLMFILSSCNFIMIIFCFTLMQCNTVVLKAGIQRNYCIRLIKMWTPVIIRIQRLSLESLFLMSTSGTSETMVTK